MHTPGENRDRCSQYCDPKTNKYQLIHAPVGTPCDDGYFCTTASVCQMKPDGMNMVCVDRSATKNGPCTKNSFCTNTCNEMTRQCESPCTKNSFCESACNDKTQQCDSPCRGQNFCNNTCNIATQQCGSPCKASSCRSQPTCTDTPQGGTCGDSPLHSPPSCTICPCDSDGDSTLTCNATSGQCYRPSPGPSPPPSVFDTHFLSGVIGGVAGGVVVVIILFIVIYVVQKKRIQDIELRTVYHKVNGEDAQVKIVDKGL